MRIGKEGGSHFVHDILERIRAVNGEAHKEEVCFRVRERSEPVIFLLTRRVPQCELDRLTGILVFRVGDVVFEDGGDVFLHLSFSILWSASWGTGCCSYLWKHPLTITDQQARLSTSPVAHNHKLLRERWRLCDVRAGCVRAGGVLGACHGAIAIAGTLSPCDGLAAG